MEKYYKRYVTYARFIGFVLRYIPNTEESMAKYVLGDSYDNYSELYDMLNAMWGYEQISIPIYTIGIDYNDEQNVTHVKNLIREFRAALQRTCDEYASYYNEMYSNYKKEFDYATGITNSVETEGINVDLPNKKIDSESIYSYPSSGDKGKSVYTDNSKFLSMKRQYMSQIRDLNREFAKKFSDCFLHILIEREEISKEEYEEHE